MPVFAAEMVHSTVGNYSRQARSARTFHTPPVRLDVNDVSDSRVGGPASRRARLYPLTMDHLQVFSWIRGVCVSLDCRERLLNPCGTSYFETKIEYVFARIGVIIASPFLPHFEVHGKHPHSLQILGRLLVSTVYLIRPRRPSVI